MDLIEFIWAGYIYAMNLHGYHLWSSPWFSNSLIIFPGLDYQHSRSNTNLWGKVFPEKTPPPIIAFGTLYKWK